MLMRGVPKNRRNRLHQILKRKEGQNGFRILSSHPGSPSLRRQFQTFEHQRYCGLRWSMRFLIDANMPRSTAVSISVNPILFKFLLYPHVRRSADLLSRILYAAPRNYKKGTEFPQQLSRPVGSTISLLDLTHTKNAYRLVGEHECRI